MPLLENPVQSPPARLFRCFALAAALLVALPTYAQSGFNSSTPAPGRLPSVPVVILADGLDACPSNGVVKGLNPAGDGFLTVRGGPSTGHAVLDHLYNGDLVYVCRSEGDWLGIVYRRDQSNCNATTAWISSQPYTGPCYSGWVHRNWVNIYAG